MKSSTKEQQEFLPIVPPRVFQHGNVTSHEKQLWRGGKASPTPPGFIIFFFSCYVEREKEMQPTVEVGGGVREGESFSVCPHNPPYKWRLQHHNGRESTIVCQRVYRVQRPVFFHFDVEHGSVLFKNPGPDPNVVDECCVCVCVCICAQCVQHSVSV